MGLSLRALPAGDRPEGAWAPPPDHGNTTRCEELGVRPRAVSININSFRNQDAGFLPLPFPCKPEQQT